MAVTEASPAPYTPASTILDLIDRFRNRGLSTPLTKDVLERAGVSKSLIARTIPALMTLELIDEEYNPTETLENLRRVPEPELQDHLAAWIKSVYADVLSFVEPTDNETAIRDAFRGYKPVGQQTRMVSLFLGLCRAAGLRGDEPAPKPRPHARTRVGQRREPAPRKTTRKAAPAQSAPKLNVPPALEGLLNSLPASGKWSQIQRDKFLSTFEAVLDYSFEIADESEEVDHE